MTMLKRTLPRSEGFGSTEPMDEQDLRDLIAKLSYAPSSDLPVGFARWFESRAVAAYREAERLALRTWLSDHGKLRRLDDMSIPEIEGTTVAGYMSRRSGAPIQNELKLEYWQQYVGYSDAYRASLYEAPTLASLNDLRAAVAAIGGSGAKQITSLQVLATIDSGALERYRHTRKRLLFFAGLSKRGSCYFYRVKSTGRESRWNIAHVEFGPHTLTEENELVVFPERIY